MNYYKMPKRPIVVPLGGFLGAGKTTLILSAARLLQARGLRVAAVLNDQGDELVDTRQVRESGADADQVVGGCFCCRLSDLFGALDRLRAHDPDVIFAEAVGSCTDISATTLQPLKLAYAGVASIAQYSVLVDPGRALELSREPASDLAFLFEQQIAEADLVCFNKSDRYSEFPPIGGATVRMFSALTGQGVDAWLDEVLAGHGVAGSSILDIDYERYARAEAGLAWLNCRAQVTLQDPLSPAALIGPLLEKLDAALTRDRLGIAHVKLVDDSDSGHLTASIVQNGEEAHVRGMLDASPASRHELLLNARASGQPAALRRIVENELRSLPGRVEVRVMECFSPAAPKPEKRMSEVIKLDR